MHCWLILYICTTRIRRRQQTQMGRMRWMERRSRSWRWKKKLAGDESTLATCAALAGFSLSPSPSVCFCSIFRCVVWLWPLVNDSICKWLLTWRWFSMMSAPGMFLWTVLPRYNPQAEKKHIFKMLFKFYIELCCIQSCTQTWWIQPELNTLKQQTSQRSLTPSRKTCDPEQHNAAHMLTSEPVTLYCSVFLWTTALLVSLCKECRKWMSGTSLGALMMKHYVSSEKPYHPLELHIPLRNHKKEVFISCAVAIIFIAVLLSIPSKKFLPSCSFFVLYLNQS